MSASSRRTSSASSFPIFIGHRRYSYFIIKDLYRESLMGRRGFRTLAPQLRLRRAPLVLPRARLRTQGRPRQGARRHVGLRPRAAAGARTRPTSRDLAPSPAARRAALRSGRRASLAAASSRPRRASTTRWWRWGRGWSCSTEAQTTSGLLRAPRPPERNAPKAYLSPCPAVATELRSCS